MITTAMQARVEALPGWMFEALDLDLKTAMLEGTLRGNGDFLEQWLRYFEGLLAHLEGIEHLEPHDILLRLVRLGSSARLQWLAAHAHLLDDDQLAGVLPTLWCAPNMMMAPVGVSMAQALAWFERTGYVTDQGQERPSEPVRLFHGVVGDLPADDWSWMAWTGDRAVAERFATHTGEVLEGIAQPADVLARFDDRDEAEYVVDPAKVER